MIKMSRYTHYIGNNYVLIKQELGSDEEKGRLTIVNTLKTWKGNHITEFAGMEGELYDLRNVVVLE